MLEIAQNFEKMAVWFNPLVLVGPGLAAVLIGLFVWLGGLGFRNVLVTVLGAASGGICVFFISGRNILLAGLSAPLAGIIALIFEKMFIRLLAAAFAAIFSFAVLAGPYIKDSEILKRYSSRQIHTEAVLLGFDQTVEIINTYVADFTTAVKQACLQSPTYSWIIAAASAAIIIVAGFFFCRLTSALCCAVWGTVLIFTGMILLLLYKGAAPISRICLNRSFYIAVFTAMTIFGATAQLFFCGDVNEHLMRKSRKNKLTEDSDRQSRSWRNR